MTTEDEFWAHVAIPDSADPDVVKLCWPWTAGRTGSGYGILQYGGKPVYAHRLAYELAHGDLQPGQVVRHTCHNPLCVNPAHLVAGTHADNMHDMAVAGRRRARVLTEADVTRIRTSDLPAPVLAAEYGCSPTAIHMARRGETYKQVSA